MNPRFPPHVSIFEEENIPHRLTSRYSAVCYAFAVKGFCALFYLGVRGFVLTSPGTISWLHFPLTRLRSAETNLTLIYPSSKSFVCNLTDSGRHVTRPNQGLSTGRRENLGTRLNLLLFLTFSLPSFVVVAMTTPHWLDECHSTGGHSSFREYI